MEKELGTAKWRSSTERRRSECLALSLRPRQASWTQNDSEFIQDLSAKRTWQRAVHLAPKDDAGEARQSLDATEIHGLLMSFASFRHLDDYKLGLWPMALGQQLLPDVQLFLPEHLLGCRPARSMGSPPAAQHLSPLPVHPSTLHEPAKES